MNSPADYEKLVAEIVSGITNSAPVMSGYSLGFGAQNKIHGASRQPHQFDVSLTSASELYCIECKRWRKRIGVEAVLVLIARTADMREARPGCRVHSILVSTAEPTRGAKRLAQHYGVQLEVVESPVVFGMKIGQRIQNGISSGIRASDSVVPTVTRGGASVD